MMQTQSWMMQTHSTTAGILPMAVPEMQDSPILLRTFREGSALRTS
jgi:hypothetical protein